MEYQKSDFIPLWEHQKKAIAQFKSRDSLMLAFDTGTGKTRTATHIVGLLRAQDWALIITPKSVLETFRRELVRWEPKLAARIVVVEGTKDQRKKKLSEAKNGSVVLMSYHTANTETFKELLKIPFTLIVCDESHWLKESSASWTKRITKLSENIPKRLLMTGTPILNSEMDIFSQFKILDPSIFGSNFVAFKKKYFKDENAAWSRKLGYFPKWVIKPGSVKELHQIFTEHAIRITKKECLQLPPLLEQVHYCDIAEMTAPLYKQMKDDFIAFLGAHIVTAPIALTQIIRLRQLCDGILATDAGEQHIDCSKYGLLEEILNGIPKGHKVIIWSTFRSTYGRINGVCKRAGFEAVFITGDQLADERQRSIDAFNSDDSCRAVIANPAAGGVGISLVAASYMIYFSKDYNLAHDLQSEARAYRHGSEIHGSVTRIDMLTKGSVEEVIHDALRKKLDAAEFLQTLKRSL